MTKDNFIKTYKPYGIEIETTDGKTIKGLFTDLRVKNCDVPKGMCKYEIRWDDDFRDYATIEEHVFVNHAGTLITNKPVDFDGDDYIDIDDYSFIDEDDDDDEGREHRIIDTEYGEVMVKSAYDCETDESFCDCYIGDNYDCYIGEVPCNYWEDDDETIASEIERVLGYKFMEI